jgi:phosphopantetheine adenylyltransferase
MDYLSSFDNSNKILNESVLNGRVNIIEQPTTDIIFKMQERVSVKNKTTEYRNAVSTEEESSILAKVYFSAENIQIIQNGLRAGVYKLSNNTHIITPQNPDVLKVIMRSIYLQYSEHKPDITKEVEHLNSLVLDYAVPNVYNGVLGYVKYIEDISTLVTPLDLPRQSDRDYKQLESKPWV